MSMEYEIKDLKNIRKKLGITQEELADKSGVSQSLIAKMESGIIDPSYSNVQKIFHTIEEMREKKDVKAEDIMERHIITIDKKTKIHEAIEKMKKHSISQIPVLNNDAVVGLVSESGLLDALLKRHATTVGEIMEDNPPSVSKTTSISVVMNLLKFYPMVLVMENGVIKGIVTKSDVLKKMY